MLNDSVRGVPFESNSLLKKMWLKKAKEAKEAGLPYREYMCRASAIDYGYMLNDYRSKSSRRKWAKLRKTSITH